MKGIFEMLGETIVYAIILMGALALLGDALMELTSY